MKIMKLRHVALASALLGWYLLAPPQTRVWWIGAQRSDDGAALSSWTIQRSYDQAGACEAARQAVAQSHEVCIATNDPRLKQF
jgi:hypothetical protein